MDHLLIRLAGPMMSFGGDRVNDAGPTGRWPLRSFLTGLLGSVLGYDVTETDRLATLQEAIRFGVRCDRPGTLNRDFRTITIDQVPLRERPNEYGWEEIRGGDTRRKTIVRIDYFLAGACYTVALRVPPGEGLPTHDEVEHALKYPYRSIYLGRSSYIPTEHPFFGRVKAGSIKEALCQRADQGSYAALWPLEEGGGRILELCEDRDWESGIHVGSRFHREGALEVQ